VGVPSRICVVGNSGSGKTRLAQRLAAQLGLPHLELDALNHRPGWSEAPRDDFRAEVAEALNGYESTHGGWVVDGNYRSRIGDLLHPDTYVWLDYPRRVVFPRMVRRTLSRVARRTELWNGNRERWTSLVKLNPRENIVLWSWTQHSLYRSSYQAASLADRQATWVRLRSPRDAERWLSTAPARPRDPGGTGT
jgi:adenylate kinase family enzyme